jgi:hypothetical protein
MILRNNRVEVHYQIDAETMRSSARPPGDRVLGVDKGYTEAFTDSDGEHHGDRLGELLAAESDHRAIKNTRRAKIRVIAEKLPPRAICRKRRASRSTTSVRSNGPAATGVLNLKSAPWCFAPLMPWWTRRARL